MKNKRPLLLMLVFALLLTIFAGCAAKPASETPASEDYYAEEPAYEPETAAEEAASDYDEPAYTLGRMEQESEPTADPADAPENNKPSLADKIIYSGYLYIETTKFDEAVAAVEAKVQQFGGFVESSDVSGRTEYRPDGTTSLVDRNANYVVRVPCAKFDAFIKQSGSLGNVLSSNTSAENITSQFTDAEARKASLKVQEERLLAMMEKTEDVESLIALEERLSEVRYEYEGIERRLINWQNQVDYSTVSLQLKEVAVYTPVAPVQRTFGEKLRSAFTDGWNGFVRFCEGLTLFLAEALPTLILLGLLALAIVLIVRGSVRRSRKKHQDRAARAAAAYPAAPAQKPAAPNPTIPDPTVPNPTIKDFDAKSK